MAHTKPENLKDLSAELAAIRALPGMVEKKPGIFYFKSAGILHFHDKDGTRWADVKLAGEWTRVDVDFGASKAAKAKLLKMASAALAQFQKAAK